MRQSSVFSRSFHGIGRLGVDTVQLARAGACDSEGWPARRVAVGAYLQHMLAGKVAPADADAATELLLARSEGLFLYLAFVCERLQIVSEDCPAALEDLESFPISLSSVYENDFRRAFGSAESSDWHDAQALLTMVFAALEPLPTKVLAVIARPVNDHQSDEYECARVTLMVTC